MGQLLDLQLKLFIFMLIGALLKRLGIITEQGRDSLTDLVIYAILPCNIIVSFLQVFSRDKLILLVSIFLVSVGLQAVCGFIGKRMYKQQNKGRRTILYYGTICSNAGFLGNVIAEELYSGFGLALASVYLIPQRVIMWSVGVGLFSNCRDKRKLLLKVSAHPCVISVFIGLFLMVTQLRLPEIILDPLRDISACNTAISMIVVGTILGDIKMKHFVDKTILTFSVIRLFAIPLCVYVTGRLLHLDGTVAGVATILAAMPVPVTTAILAQKYNGDSAFATRCIVVTTAFSIVTIPLWSILLIM